MAELAAAMSVPGAFANLKISCPCCAPLQLDDDDDDAVPPDQLDELPPELAACLVFDSHCHLFAETTDARYAGITQATEESNWPTVLAACASRRLRPGLGVHPWQAHLVDDVDAFVGRLAANLAAHPAAIVGEIGLCKCAKNVRGAKEERERGLARQRAVFDAQLRLAARLGRPASVHAVKQHAPLKAALGAVEATPGFAVALHSFSGTAHHVKELLALVDYPLFFGFSPTQCINQIVAATRLTG